MGDQGNILTVGKVVNGLVYDHTVWLLALFRLKVDNGRKEYCCSWKSFFLFYLQVSLALLADQLVSQWWLGGLFLPATQLFVVSYLVVWVQ